MGIYLINFDNPELPPSVANHSALAISRTSSRQPNTCAYSLHEIATKMYLVLYLHWFAWIPVPLTWIQAIYAGFYATWPGLIAAHIRNHLPKIIYTSKGHLCQEHKNLQSAKKQTYIMMAPEKIEIPGAWAHLIMSKNWDKW